MAGARAFKALRFTAAAGPLEGLIAPPYDVIGPAEREQLASRNPRNIVHLILPEGSADASAPDNRYARAGALLADWLRQGFLEVERDDSMTVVQEEFLAGGRRHVRTGAILALRIDRYGEGEVFPHENTLAAPRADRLALFRATRANLSPVFALVPDAAGALARLLAGVASARGPDAELAGPDAVLRRVWFVRDAAFSGGVARALEGLPCVLADGHHRYETALAYRDELVAAGCEPGEASHVLCYVVAVDDPGLVVLPTHRVLPPGIGPAGEELVERLAQRFEIEPCSREEATAFPLEEARAGGPQAFVIGAGRRLRCWRASLRDPAAMRERFPHRSEGWRSLDVTCLHSFVLEDVCGIGPREAAESGLISYTHDADVALAALEHEGGLCFIMRATPPRAVLDVALAGERMPQKSTFFYPKVAAGLAMRLLA